MNLPTSAIWLFQKHDTSFENKNAIHLVLKATHILENKKPIDLTQMIINTKCLVF